MTGLGSSCGACKFLRRKCTSECVFAPYFCYDQAANHFAAVHKVFGASNVSKLLLHLPIQTRSDAAITISYEALARIRDPIYGCVAHIFALQEQVANLQEEIEILGSQMMANHGIGNWGGSQFTHNNVGLQTPNPIGNLQFYQNQQAPLFSFAGNYMPPSNEDLDDDLVNSHIPFPPSSYYEEQSSYFVDSDSHLLERFLEGVDDENFTLDPWLSNVIDAGK